MAVDENGNEIEETVTTEDEGEITDEELAAVFGDIIEEEKKVAVKPDAQVVTPVVPEEPDNAEKSRLGRRLKAIEEARVKDSETLQMILERLGNKPDDSTKTEELDDPDIDLEEIARLEKLDRYREKKRQESIDKYQASYKAEVAKYKDDPEYEDALALMKTKPEFDKIYTGDPARDAELNFEKAARAALRVKGVAKGKEKPPVHGDDLDEEVSTGLSGTSTNPHRAIKAPKLDDTAKEYIAFIEQREGKKMTDEEIAEALKD